MYLCELPTGSLKSLRVRIRRCNGFHTRRTETGNSYPRANALIFKVAPADPDASILDVFKGAREHDGDGGYGVGDGNGDGDRNGDGGGGRCVLVMSVLE